MINFTLQPMMKPIFESRSVYTTLIEILIAMSLTSIILSTLFFFYSQVVMIGSEIEKTKEEAFRLRFMEKRLSEVLPNIAGNKNKEFTFFSLNNTIGMPGSQSLVFTYDNGNCLAKQFAYLVTGRLMLDAEGNILLFTFPLPKKKSSDDQQPNINKQVLFTKAASLKFEYFIPLKSPSTGKTSTNAIEPEPKGKWRTENWLKEFKSLPAMIKMIVKMSNGEPDIVFVFAPNENKTHIIYE